MTELKVDTVVNLAGTGKPNFENGITVNSAATSTLNLNEYTESSSEPSSPSNGALWWDTANEKTFIYAEGEWKETIGIAGGITWGGDRGVMGGGRTGGSSSNVISYITILSTGNATDFGDLTEARQSIGSLSNATRGLWFGGYLSSLSNLKNIIDYVTISTAGNATDFGDLQSSKAWTDAASCNGTIGIVAGGYSGSNSNEIDKIIPATTGNATDFGDVTTGLYGGTSFADATRGVIAGGYTSQSAVTTEYITYATTGNTTDFGDLTVGAYELGSVSDATRGVVAGGRGNSAITNVMQYFTTQTTGNATDFGDLTVARTLSGMSNTTYGVFSHGYNSSSGDNNVMDYITVQTLGNATDFGDYVANFSESGACSGSAS